MQVLVLASGGIDSTACLHYYLKLNHKVSALYINYGQQSAQQEILCATKICKLYKVKLNCISIDGGMKWGAGEILGRNAFLLLTGLMNCEFSTGIISMGIHSGTNYWDCGKNFVEIMQKIFLGYTQGQIQLGFPFINFSKSEIIAYSKLEMIPLASTYSCEIGTIPPCGNCASCKDREGVKCH